MKQDKIKLAVAERYARVARREASGRCDTTCCSDAGTGTGSEKLGYSTQELESVPTGSDMGLGCGNPQAIANLKPGETVLDLGSGGGFDCFLAARQVGDAGKVIGVDMTPDMIHKARENAEKGKYSNVEFRLGEIENLPVADASADVIISNCVINLSPDKQAVFNEAFRVLKPGGRLAISDVVARTQIPESMQADLDLHGSCISGAEEQKKLTEMIVNAGFEKTKISPKNSSEEFIQDWIPGSRIQDLILSASIEATKPA